MRKTKLAGVLATAGLAVGMLAAPIAQAQPPVGPPGQVCQEFLEGVENLLPNAQGKCASFVAQGGNPEDAPGLCDPVVGCVRPGPVQ